LCNLTERANRERTPGTFGNLLQLVQEAFHIVEKVGDRSLNKVEQVLALRRLGLDKLGRKSIRSALAVDTVDLETERSPSIRVSIEIVSDEEDELDKMQRHVSEGSKHNLRAKGSSLTDSSCLNLAAPWSATDASRICSAA
jgi:hypothetical protein